MTLNMSNMRVPYYPLNNDLSLHEAAILHSSQEMAQNRAQYRAQREAELRERFAQHAAQIRETTSIQARKLQKNVKIFLSYPEPREAQQREFADEIIRWLKRQGFIPVRLGSINFSLEAPLEAVRDLISQCSGLLCIAFRRTHVTHATMIQRKGDGTYTDLAVEDAFLTSPWCHIESAMAYQRNLPMIILRETRVVKEGVLDYGNTVRFMPAFNLDTERGVRYLKSNEWKALSKSWNQEIWQSVGWDDPDHVYYDEERRRFVP